MNKTAAAGQGQPARESNINAIVSYFESGIKAFGGPGELGIELEQIIVHDDMSPVSYSGEHGVAWVLRQLEADYPRTTTDEHGDLLGVARPSEAVTIEPAAQIELSAGPFADLATARDTFEGFAQRLSDVLEPAGEKALAIGYHPSATARSLELIPKRRYQFMNLYLGERDIYGPCMMRGSASTQVSIDYTSTADCLRKLRLAYALVPILSLITDNTPVFEGKPRTHQLVRTKIWQHMDNDRCGLVPGVLEPPGSTFEATPPTSLTLQPSWFPAKRLVSNPAAPDKSSSSAVVRSTSNSGYSPSSSNNAMANAIPIPSSAPSVVSPPVVR